MKQTSALDTRDSRARDVGSAPTTGGPAGLGFWSAIAVTVFSLAFSTTAILGSLGALGFPWDPVLPDGASLLLGIAFVVMMVCLHHAVEEPARVWTHLGVAFAVMYAVLVSIVYFVITTVVVPRIDRGQAGLVEPFAFDDGGSFMQALDGLGYFFLCLSTLSAAFAFSGRGATRWLRRAFLLNGVLGVPILLLYMPLVISWSRYLMPIGALWMLSVPVCGLLAAQYLGGQVSHRGRPVHRGGSAPSQHA